MAQTQVERKPLVGESLGSVDGIEKVTGRAVYPYDYSVPNMLHAKVLRSPIPHGRIVRIDTSKLEVPGVRAVITSKDLPDARFGKGLRDATALASGKVLYIGEPVVAVAADTEDQALAALEQIEVEYEELPAVFDPVQAADEKPPVILHEALPAYARATEGPYAIHLVPSRPNVNSFHQVINGDVGEGMKGADFVVENVYRTPRVHHYHTEPVACLAKPEGGGSVTVFTGAQGLDKIRSVVSSALDLPESKVKVVIPAHIGGAFGNRASGREEVICAALALKSRRPVQLKLTREEVMTATTSRHAAVVKVRDGVKKTGELVARDVEVYLAGGAYSTEGITAVPNAARAVSSTYYIPNFRAKIFRAYTNEMEGGAMRAFGYTYVIFALESQMDRVAEKLGVDPVELRTRHMLKNGQTSVLGDVVAGDTLDQCLGRVLEEMSSPAPPSGPTKANGRGFAIGHKGLYGNYPTIAYVKYSSDDTIEIRAGIIDVGQGARTVAVQLVADRFDHPPEKVKLSELDSDSVPSSPGAMGSRQTFHIGNALLEACDDCERQILQTASARLGKPVRGLAVREGWVVDDAAERLVRVRELFNRGPAGGDYVREVGEFLGKGVFYVATGSIDPRSGKSSGGRSVACYTPAAAGAEVTVDRETGRTALKRIVVAVDAGRVLNLALVEGQIDGCVSQGIGTALFEELVTMNGRILNPDNKDYKVPMISDVSPVVKKIILENPVEGFRLGVRGSGEVALAVVPAAIANAVSNAIGKGVNELPLTAERVLAAIKGPT